ncbi:hypothetical protein TREES_T100012871 [Tupaia chinensis]|uniref:Uncharacterized protein n=1 Tax=Tupaia chinensis TaxID=246437 RepID=L9LAP2_TUPCH|nr:hypothetical protein TREES_T100012871 [Tupaia chinensis]
MVARRPAGPQQERLLSGEGARSLRHSASLRYGLSWPLSSLAHGLQGSGHTLCPAPPTAGVFVLQRDSGTDRAVNAVNAPVHGTLARWSQFPHASPGAALLLKYRPEKGRCHCYRTLAGLSTSRTEHRGLGKGLPPRAARLPVEGHDWAVLASPGQQSRKGHESAQYGAMDCRSLAGPPGIKDRLPPPATPSFLQALPGTARWSRSPRLSKQCLHKATVGTATAWSGDLPSVGPGPAQPGSSSNSVWQQLWSEIQRNLASVQETQPPQALVRTLHVPSDYLPVTAASGSGRNLCPDRIARAYLGTYADTIPRAYPASRVNVGQHSAVTDLHVALLSSLESKTPTECATSVMGRSLAFPGTPGGHVSLRDQKKPNRDHTQQSATLDRGVPAVVAAAGPGAHSMVRTAVSAWGMQSRGPASAEAEPPLNKGPETVSATAGYCSGLLVSAGCAVLGWQSMAVALKCQSKEDEVTIAAGDWAWQQCALTHCRRCRWSQGHGRQAAFGGQRSMF